MEVLFSQINFTMDQVTAKNKQLTALESLVVSTAMVLDFFQVDKCSRKQRTALVVLLRSQLAKARVPHFLKIKDPKAIHA